MANELKIRVVFDTGGTKPPTEQVKVLEGSLKDLELQYKKLQAIAEKSFIAGSPEQIAAMAKAQEALVKYKAALGDVSSVMPNVTKSSANAAMTLQALNYTVRDSPYFFRDFSLGILAIGNNLNPLIDGFIRMRNEAKEGESAMKVLWNSMKGSQGVIFAFSVLVSMLQAVTFAMAKSKSATKDAADEFERFLKMPFQELESIKGINITKMYREELKVLAEINEGRKKIGFQPLATLPTGGKALEGYDFMERYGHLFSDEYKQMRLINEEIDKKKVGMGRIVELQNDITALQKLQAAATTDELTKSFNPLIEAKKKKLDDLLGKNKKGKDEFGYLAPMLAELERLEKQKPFAKTREEAEKLQEEIQKVNDKLDAFNNRITTQEKVSQLALASKIEFEDKFQEKLAKGIEKHKKDEMETAIHVAELKAKLIEDETKKKEALLDLEFAKAQAILEVRLILKEITDEEYRQLSELLDRANIKAKRDVREDAKNKEMKLTLRGIEQAANVAGNAVSNAFLTGGNAIDAAARALKQFIVQLLVVKSFEYLLKLVFAPSSLPKTFAGFLGFSSSTMPQIVGGTNMPNIGTQKTLQAMNMNMQSAQPTILIKTDIPGLKFTKEVINPSQAKLIRGNVKSVL